MALSNLTDPSTPEVTEVPGSKIVLSLTLSVLAVLTIAINSLVITAIIVTRKLHHPANYLIGSLAVTDLLVAILVMPFSIAYIVTEHWIMGQVVCGIWLAVDITCCTCSILHLAAIAVDRYWAITDAVAYSHKRTPTRAAIMIVMVWVLSVLISLPPVLLRQHENSNMTSDIKESHEQCLIKHSIGFAIYSTFGAFYIPLLLIVILYYKIYHAAKSLYEKRGAIRIRKQAMNGHTLPACRDREPHGHKTLSPPEKSFSDLSTEVERVHITPKSSHLVPRHKKSSTHRISGRRERKAATTLGLILGAFIICWLPFFVHEVIVNTCGPCQTSGELANFLTWLGYLNSLINPLLYTIFNEDFKKAFQKLIWCSQSLSIEKSQSQLE
ncbi:5-hydroxytryptamine receptor 1F [Alosa sapidissima]|uniref:5-hydroxytryptamine receptor 1F n=1 Tax=Alosa sapidissima TaxID=34773 RepID=UPI001C08FF3F|nr:5-hydroxytryptamine receptor 1F [Alosa sapidissima]XP_041933087.1 5-hydroxytryptamine receptor 1F [Alosa sapidissima]XP_041933096.1 5-hydroxytryptamine receptor 1F [Alosa sapidissima]